MNNPTISIVIPIYNSANYLEKCLSSLKFQTFTDFEAILINDGSTDSSIDICDSYSQKDKRFKVFTQINSGVSAARNNGIQKSLGKYICFVDSDDWVDNEYLEKFDLNLNVEFQIQGLTIWHENNLENEHIRFSKHGIFENDFLLNAIELAERNNIIRSPYVKIFHSYIIKDNDLKFNEDIAYGEDMIFVFEYLMYTKGINIIDYSGYYYAQRENESLTKKYIPFLMRYKYFNTVFNLRKKLLLKLNIEPCNSYIKFINYSNAYSLITLILGIFDKRSKLSINERNSYIKLIKQDKKIPLLFKTNDLPIFHKVSRLILRFCKPKFSEILLRKLVSLKKIQF